MMKGIIPFTILLLTALFLSGCAAQEKGAAEPFTVSSSLVFEERMALSDAKEFAVDCYEGGYRLLTIAGEERYLVIPEGKESPKDLDSEITPIQQPLENIYMAGSATMDMFAALDAMEMISFSSLPAEDWTIESARAAMEAGAIRYVGKYSAPDYEQLRAGGCSLAVENTMIFHSPEIKEQLESFGIPVLVDRSSYETTPQGRMEWVKLYGVLTGKEEEAVEAYERQAASIRSVKHPDTSQTVAFFYIASNGEVKVRRSNDYVAQMIELAGGRYAFQGLGEEGKLSTVTLQMEEFYAGSREADYLIYNSTVDGQLSSLDALIGKNELLADFAAVKNKRAFCTRENFYQASMELGDFVADVNRMLGGQREGLVYLEPLE